MEEIDYDDVMSYGLDDQIGMIRMKTKRKIIDEQHISNTWTPIFILGKIKEGKTMMGVNP